MRKLFRAGRGQTLLALLVLFGIAAASTARADDRFAIAVGQHGDLLIYGPKGEKVADLPIPSISQPVTVNGTTSFQVSYGRDVNDRLTAILAPNPTQPEDLHFSVLNKSIDADKSAVVTLTFSRGLGSVTVDPGYVGLVQVNSEKVRHHDLADEYGPAPTPAPIYQPVSTSPPPTTAYNPAPAPVSSTPAPLLNPTGAPGDTSSASSSSLPDGSGPENPAMASDASSGAAPADTHLYWSEPVTDPNGNAPHVGLHQMKLVEVQGAVSVHTPGGDEVDGTEGMIVPSGSVVSTSDGSSAAVFIGGVDSARLMPNSDVGVVDHFDGSVRHTTIDLQKGTVFSRIGHRAGETEKYEVSTPEGVAAARGTEVCDSRYNGHHYVFVLKGDVGLYVASQLLTEIIGHGGSGIGMGAMPPAGDGAALLRHILQEVQQFNTKTNLVLHHIHDGTATGAELAYYTAAIYGALIQEGFTPGIDTYLAAQIGAVVTVAFHDLVPYQMPPATKY